MPIYEFVCQDCDRRFEVIVRSGAVPTCPACHGERLERQLSVFAVGGRPTERTTSPCGSCGDPRGPGACNLS